MLQTNFVYVANSLAVLFSISRRLYKVQLIMSIHILYKAKSGSPFLKKNNNCESAHTIVKLVTVQIQDVGCHKCNKRSRNHYSCCLICHIKDSQYSQDERKPQQCSSRRIVQLLSQVYVSTNNCKTSENGNSQMRNRKLCEKIREQRMCG